MASMGNVCPGLYDEGRDRSRGKTRVRQNSIPFVQGRLGTFFTPAGSDAITSSRYKTWSQGCHVVFPHTWVNKILTPFVSSRTRGPHNDSAASTVSWGRAKPGERAEDEEKQFGQFCIDHATGRTGVGSE